MAIELDNVYKIYKSFQVDVVALHGVSAYIDEGSFVMILGPSGSGKTTLLNLIGGLDKPTSGRVIVDGVELSKLGENELIKFRREKIGFVFQFFNLIPYLTAYENVEFPLIVLNKPREERKKIVDSLLEMVGLKDRSHHKPHQLSGGEQQRVAIAMALAHDPKILIADEPTGELDTENTVKIGEILEEINIERGTTIVVATHDYLFASYGKRIIRLRDGKIVSDMLVPVAGAKALGVGGNKEVILTELIKRKNKILSELERLKKLFKMDKIDDEYFMENYSKLKKDLEKVEREIESHMIG